MARTAASRNGWSGWLSLLITMVWTIQASADMEPIALYPMEGIECLENRFEDKTAGEGLGVMQVASGFEPVSKACSYDDAFHGTHPKLRSFNGGMYFIRAGWMNSSVPFVNLLKKTNANSFSLEFWTAVARNRWRPGPDRKKVRLFTVGRPEQGVQGTYSCEGEDYSISVYFEPQGVINTIGSDLVSLLLTAEIREGGVCHKVSRSVELKRVVPYSSPVTLHIVVSMSAEKGWTVFLTSLYEVGPRETFAVPLVGLPSITTDKIDASHFFMLGGDPNVTKVSSDYTDSWRGDIFSFVAYKSALDQAQVNALAEKNLFLGLDSIPMGKEGQATSFKPMSDFLLERFNNKYATGEGSTLLEVQNMSTKPFYPFDGDITGVLTIPEVEGKLYLGKEPFKKEESVLMAPPFTFDQTKETLFFYPDDLDAFGGLVEVTMTSTPPGLGKSWTKSMVAFIEPVTDPPVLDATPSKGTRVAAMPTGTREADIYRVVVNVTDPDCPNTDTLYTNNIKVSRSEEWIAQCTFSGIREIAVFPNMTFGSLYYTRDPDGCTPTRLERANKLQNNVFRTLPLTPQGSTYYLCYQDECATLGCPGLEDGTVLKDQVSLSTTDGRFAKASITYEFLLDNGLRPAEPMQPAKQVSLGVDIFEFKLTGLDLVCEDINGVKLSGPPSFQATCASRKKQFVITSLPPESQGVLYLTQDLASAITQEQIGEDGLVLAEGVNTIFFRPAKSYFNRERWPLCDPSGKVSMCPNVEDTATCGGPQRDTSDPLSCLGETGSSGLPAYTVQDLSGNLLGGCDASVSPMRTPAQFLSSGCPIAFKYSLRVQDQMSMPADSQQAWIVNTHKPADLVNPIQDKLQVSANEQVAVRGKNGECVTIDTHGEGDVRVLQVDITLRGDGLLRLSNQDLDERLIQYTENGDKREEGADKFSIVGVASTIQAELCEMKVLATRGDISVTLDLSDVADSRKGSDSKVTVVSRSIHVFVNAGSPSNSQAPDEQPSTSPGVIVGAAVGGVAAMAAVAAAVMYYRRRKSAVDDSRLSVAYVP